MMRARTHSEREILEWEHRVQLYQQIFRQSFLTPSLYEKAEARRLAKRACASVDWCRVS